MDNHSYKTQYSQPLTDLKSLSNRDKIWDQHRSTASIVEDIYQYSNQPFLQKYAERINHCSPWLKFDYIGNKLKLRQAFFCKVRTCPVCSWRKSLAWKARLHKALPELKAKHPHGQWLFLTLTLKNCYITELKENLKLINSSWDKLSRRKKIRKNLLGYIKAVEITRGKNNTAHPHLHVLLYVKSTYFKNSDNYISSQQWAEEWQSALKVSYLPVVDIRKVKASSKKKSLDSAISEIVKYSVKSTDLTANDFWLKEYTSQILKTRAISSGGVLREIISEVSGKEMIELENNKEVEDSTKSFNAYWFELSQKYRGTFV